MKILHLSYSPDGGSGQVMGQLVKAQNELGHTAKAVFTVLSGGLRNNLLVHPTQTAAALVDNWLIRKSNEHKSPFSIFRRSLPDFQSENDYDIVHLHWTASPIYSPEILALADSGTPVIQTLHDINPVSGGCHLPHDLRCFGEGCSGCPVARGAFKQLVKHRRQRADSAVTKENIQLVAVSQELREMLAGTPASMPVIPNPIRSEFMNRRIESAPTKKIRILFVAADVHDPWKNLSFAKAVVRKLEDLGKAASLKIIGRFTRVDEGIPPENFLGQLNPDELAREFASSTVLLIPSLGESFSLTAHEAALMGCPSISMANRLGPGIEDIGGFRCSDVSEAADVSSYVAESGYRVPLEVRNKIALHSSEKVVAMKYLALYDKVLSLAQTKNGIR